MGFSISKLSEGLKTVTHPDPDGGDPFTVTYRLGAVSHEELVELRAQAIADDAATEGTTVLLPEVDAIGVIVDMVARSVVEWNLTDVDGAPYGTDRTTISKLPIDVLGFVWNLIDGDQAAEGKEPATSGAGSSRKVAGKAKKAPGTTRRTNGGSAKPPTTGTARRSS